MRVVDANNVLSLGSSERTFSTVQHKTYSEAKIWRTRHAVDLVREAVEVIEVRT